MSEGVVRMTISFDNGGHYSPVTDRSLQGRLLRGKGALVRVILILRECIWNAPAASLVLPGFDDTRSRFHTG